MSGSGRSNQPGGSTPELVMDTGPLSHFAAAGWLGALRFVADGAVVVIPDAVEAELRSGLSQHPALQGVLDASWIERRVLDSVEELTSFGGFTKKLVGSDGRNVGEAAVLAYAQVHAATAVIDDGAGRKAGAAVNVAVRGTLGLLADAVRQHRLTIEMVSELADHLLETEYRLPLGPGGFAQWAQDCGLIQK